MGGLLSFSLAMLDEENNGFILNSVHTSDGCYTYTKEIHEGKCELELGNEERLALEKAIGSDAIIQEKYITAMVCAPDIDEAREYFRSFGANLTANFTRLHSVCVELGLSDRLRTSSVCMV